MKISYVLISKISNTLLVCPKCRDEMYRRVQIYEVFEIENASKQAQAYKSVHDIYGVNVKFAW